MPLIAKISALSETDKFIILIFVFSGWQQIQMLETSIEGTKTVSKNS